eukprot:5948507-Pyramimonas_sp.AAC.1
MAQQIPASTCLGSRSGPSPPRPARAIPARWGACGQGRKKQCLCRPRMQKAEPGVSKLNTCT